MILYDEGRLDLDAPVIKYLPAFGGGNKDQVTVRQLLTHRSGLPAGRDLWRLATNAEEAKSIVLATPLTCAPGSCYIYSDLGADVMGWTIDFFDAGSGADCLSADVKVLASVGIFTNQTPDATHKKAMLATGDIVIVTTSPPTVTGNAAATMGAEGVNAIVGTINISEFHLRTDLTADRISGTLNAGGTDGMGNAKAVTGMFSAPVCE